MRRVLVVLAAVAPALAGCGGSRVVGPQISSGYSPMEALYAFNDRDALVEVFGNPFGGDKAAFDRKVTDAMQNRAGGVAARFTTAPDDSAKRGYRIAFAFNPTDNEPRGRVCRTPPQATAAPLSGPPYRLYVEASFCGGGGDYTSARGWLDAATGVDDPNFRHLIGDLTSSLFPRGETESCGGPDC